MKFSLGRSFGAIFVGFFALAGLSTIGRFIVFKFLSATDMNNLTALTPQQNILLWLNNAIAGLLGGYLVASLAGAKRLAHAICMGAAIFTLGLVFLVLNKNAPVTTYTIVALIGLPLGVIVGGWLRSLKKDAAS